MRAQRRRGVLPCLALIAVTVAATPFAQAPDAASIPLKLSEPGAPALARAELAARISTALLDEWLGPAPLPTDPIEVIVPWPPSPATMAVESAVAYEMARRRWTAVDRSTTVLMNGAAWYLQSRIVSRLFDWTFGPTRHSADSIRLFGGRYRVAFPQLVFDGPAAGLGRESLDREPMFRAAHAFGSLERLAGQPRTMGALRAIINRHPRSDAEVIGGLGEALGEDINWLFEGVVDPSREMNYAVAAVRVEPCDPSPCQRVSVDVTHEGGGSFGGRDALEVRVDFADGQSAASRWDGREPARTFSFEGPVRPIRVRLDPDSAMLLDTNLLDQTRELDAVTNAPIGKWTARWFVWLQDAMLAFTAFI
jgi:hypothetical protein